MTWSRGMPNLAPLFPVVTLALCPEPTPGVILNETSAHGAILARRSISHAESRFIMTPVSATSSSSLLETFTPVYMMRSGVNPAFRQVLTSPMDTASIPEPSCSRTRRMARLVFALQA